MESPSEKTVPIDFARGLEKEIQGFVYIKQAIEMQRNQVMAELVAHRKALEELEIEFSRFINKWDVINHPDDYPQIWEARRLLGKLPESATRPAI